MKILEFDAKYYEVKLSLESVPEKYKESGLWNWIQGGEKFTFKEVRSRKVQLLREIKDPRERESVSSEKLANLPTGVEFPNHLKDKIRYNATKQLLSYTGVMTEEEKEELLATIKKNKVKRIGKRKKKNWLVHDYAKAIRALFQKSHAYTYNTYIGVVAKCYIGSYAHDKIVSSYEVPVRLILDIKREIIEQLEAAPGGYTHSLVYWDLDGKKMYSPMGEWKAEQWLFRNKVCFIYNKKEDYDEEKTALLILEHIDKERIKFERLKEKHLGTGSKAGKPCEEDYRDISEAVRIYVWRRDGGKCVKCGSKEKLEYDHIIPVSKGGSNTARNVELLCEKCNREKSGNIG